MGYKELATLREFDYATAMTYRRLRCLQSQARHAWIESGRVSTCRRPIEFIARVFEPAPLCGVFVEALMILYRIAAVASAWALKKLKGKNGWCDRSGP